MPPKQRPSRDTTRKRASSSGSRPKGDRSGRPGLLFTRISIVYYKANEPEPWLATIEDFPKKMLRSRPASPPHGHGRTIKTALQLALREASALAWAYRKLHGGRL